MPKYKNLYGMKFGNLEVIGEEPIRKNKNTFWLCKCVCGNRKYFFQGNLTRGFSKSCGCLTYRNRKYKKYADKKLKNTLRSMKSRCYNPKNDHYKNYGARGIKICDEWLNNSEEFYKWAFENGYNPSLSSFECTIDRINTNGDYEPTNCRWVNMTIQANNRTNNRLTTISGVTKTSAEWARYYDISDQAFFERLKNGWYN